MQIFETHLKLKNTLAKHPGKVGFVPTMGALHQGHLSLIERAINENEWVVVSIFVNPTQFNDPKDLEKYPRDLTQDLNLLEVYGNQLLIYLPSISELYGNTVKAGTYDFGSLDKVMEGAFRENHFNGVATVVEKLFRNIQPDTAYFGEKDFQQLTIIQELVKMQGLTITIQPCPIIREKDGLAMSSRNALLTKEERTAAPIIYKMLQYAQATFKQQKTTTIAASIRKEIEAFPFFELEYFNLVNAKTLLPEITINNHDTYRAFIAVRTPKIRLIDNVKLG